MLLQAARLTLRGVFFARRLTERVGVRLVAGRVTPARSGFQAASIENRDVAARVADQLARLQRPGGPSDACATHTEHVSEEFMSHAEVIGVRPISRHEEPARKPRLHDMEAGTGGGLCQLAQEHMDVAVQAISQGWAVCELAAEWHRFHSPGRAR